jgi:hypothetical protein
MNSTAAEYGVILAVADRLWETAWALDKARGDTAASDWAARQVHDLMRRGRADDPHAVAPIISALEQRLRREQGQPVVQRAGHGA